MEDKTVLIVDSYVDRIRDSLNNLKVFVKSSGRKISEYEFKSIKKDFNRILYFSSACDLLDIANLASFGHPLIDELMKSSLFISEELGGMLGLLIQKIEIMLARMWFASDKNVESLKTDISVDELLQYFTENRNEFIFRPQIRKLKFSKDQNQQIGVNIPSNILNKCAKNEFLSIIIIDFFEFENRYDWLFTEIDKLVAEDVLLLHGSLEVENKDLLGDNPGLPYYLLLKTDRPSLDYLKDKGISGKLLKELYKPKAELAEIVKTPAVQSAASSQSGGVGLTDSKMEEFKKSLKNSVKVAVREEIQETVVKMVKEEVSEVVKNTVMTEVDRFIDSTKKKSRHEIRKVQLAGKKVKFSIGSKLILFFTIMIISSLSAIGVIATIFFRDNIMMTIEDSNQGISSVLASKVEDQLETIRGNAENLIIGSNKIIDGRLSEYVENYFGKNGSVVYVAIPDTDYEFFNRQMLGQFGVSEENVRNILTVRQVEIEDAANGSVSVFNVSSHLGKPVIGFASPTYIVANKKTSLVVFVDISNIFVKTIQTGKKSYSERYIVNDKGEIIVHPDVEQLILNKNYKDRFIVNSFIGSQGQGATYSQEEYERLVVFEGEEGEEPLEVMTKYIGSYNKINFGRLAVITEFERDKALAFLDLAIWIFVLIVLFTVGVVGLIVLLFSRSISDPLRALVFASKQIQDGNYDVELRARSHDEVGVLTESFIEMGQGLKERERIKSAFGKFVNKNIADLASKGEIKLGGEIKKASIFFSDIRSFTAISEKLAPDEVVEFLNDYMTRMVACVNQSKGVVDKYIGDAIMAVWGTPISSGNDAENAVNGVLMMRQALLEFNENRGGDKKPIIKIGCGINTGNVLAGQIGSSEKMEYTVIGDAVNLASRIEALNKPMGTDILISQATADEVKDTFRLVPMNKIKVKGKTEPQQIYAVLGRLDDPDAPKSLSELRALVGIEGKFDNINDLNLDESEEKYEIIE
ncbi:MAG: HAMP domain-containing protein [Spirochaetales bacterium]|nr:HAMP domain-containing protein [Spirochaetales bacterium]